MANPKLEANFLTNGDVSCSSWHSGHKRIVRTAVQNSLLLYPNCHSIPFLFFTSGTFLLVISIHFNFTDPHSSPPTHTPFFFFFRVKLGLDITQTYGAGMELMFELFEVLYY